MIKPTKMDRLSECEAFEGRTILTERDDAGNVRPVLVQMGMRAATTAHGRVKAALLAEVEQDGEKGVVPMPFAQATIMPKKGKGGFTPEFRLEMN
jgi:hypothetical protein